MPRFIDISGLELKSGSKVIDKIPNTNPIRWRCECVCGEIFDKQGYDLKHGRDLCPNCLYARTLQTKRDSSITWSKNKVKFKNKECDTEGCRKKALSDCEIKGKYYCRTHYISDIPWQPNGVSSTLAHYT